MSSIFILKYLSNSSFLNDVWFSATSSRYEVKFYYDGTRHRPGGLPGLHVRIMEEYDEGIIENLYMIEVLEINQYRRYMVLLIIGNECWDCQKHRLIMILVLLFYFRLNFNNEDNACVFLYSQHFLSVTNEKKKRILQIGIHSKFT
jgi:hypothetical protein